MPQISVSVKENTKKMIQEIADENEKSFSAMAASILTSYAAHWINQKSKPKSKSTKK